MPYSIKREKWFSKYACTGQHKNLKSCIFYWADGDNECQMHDGMRYIKDPVVWVNANQLSYEFLQRK